jgi:hypothetical protein
MACKLGYLLVIINAQIVLSLLHILPLYLTLDRVAFE